MNWPQMNTDKHRSDLRLSAPSARISVHRCSSVAHNQNPDFAKYSIKQNPNLNLVAATPRCVHLWPIIGIAISRKQQS
jgi:hypothetical protein